MYRVKSNIIEKSKLQKLIVSLNFSYFGNSLTPFGLSFVVVKFTQNSPTTFANFRSTRY